MQYQELNLHEHTLKRPDTYVGSIHPQISTEYILIENKIQKQEIEYTPAILRIFIEALSNAIDNVSRSKQYQVECKNIKVSIDSETGLTCVWNDGLSIPIRHHEKADTWIPDMLFGRLLTSSNYNDEEKRETSGRNGLGISLTNIFSKVFSVELVDPPSGKMYRQEWSGNMKQRSEPKITSSKLKKGYTKVSWIPDFEYFKVEKYTPEFLSLIHKYVFDAAMIVNHSGVSVYLNDVKIGMKSFKDYAKLYTEEDNSELIALTNRDESVSSSCVLLSSIGGGGGYEEISFVNGIYTKEGGVHVDAWSEPIFRLLSQKLNTKFKNLKLTAREIKPYFKIIVNCTLPNPEFATQSKHKLVAPRFNPKVELKDIQNALSWRFIEQIREMVDLKDKMVLKKSESKRAKRIDGFDPANKAGGKDAMKCTLILCEGLSAKTYAVMGIDQGSYFGNTLLKGRDWFGIMPLRGVVMNVRNSPASAILANKEIVNIIQALGVQHSVDYSIEENFKKLRYGRIMILTDADCFTGDTPVLIRKHDLLEITTFRDLYTMKELTDVYVWDHAGWTAIKAIQKKQTTKRIYSISTPSGFIQCTEDHTLMTESGEEKKASELKYGDRLLHFQKSYPMSTYQSSIRSEEAWLLGVFFTLGSMTRHHFTLACSRELQLKIDPLLQSIYGLQGHWSERETIHLESVWLLWIERIPQFLEYLSTELFCSGYAYKKVPTCILNANESAQRAFYRACVECVDCVECSNHTLEIYGQIGAQGLYILLQHLQIPTSIEPHPYNPSVWRLKIDSSSKSDSDLIMDSKSVIQNIWVQDSSEEVYDIETESHTLNAGIGRMIQHNCDGIHIQALILNLFHYLFPSLFYREGFITCMSTPIMKVTYKNEVKRFYDLDTAQKYIQSMKSKSGLTIKYYKGLGTSSDKDVKETFGQKIIEYTADEKTNENMVLLFNKEHSNYRKQWLTEFKAGGSVVSTSSSKFPISDFLNTELIKFSINDCKRSIPHLMDGFKESQRKILYACLKRNLQTPIKVAQLAGYVAENTNYHHGEGCLFDTITKMAQDFVGSNNIPLLFKDGQFGTRMQPNGSDAANARYIFTKLAPITRLILHPEDDSILTYINDDGDLIEPEYYCPILPLVLVNGANGIATGWSTSIPSYHPKVLIEWIRTFLKEDSDNYPELIPYYHGFLGEIVKDSPQKFYSYGKYERKGNKITITELPVGVWIDKYKEYLEDLLENKKIKSLKNYSKPDEILFEITEFKENPIDEALLKLKSPITTTNMVLFNSENRIQKYASPEEILREFCLHRLDYYVKRKEDLLKRIRHEYKITSNKLRFLKENSIEVFKQTEEEIVAHLTKQKYDKIDQQYDYLLNLPIKSFSQHKLQQLTEKKKQQEETIRYLEKVAPKQLWTNDLDALDKKL